MGARAREKEGKIERIEENISIIVTIHLTVVLMLNRSSPNPPSHLKVKTVLVHLKLNRMPPLPGITESVFASQQVPRSHANMCIQRAPFKEEEEKD